MSDRFSHLPHFLPPPHAPDEAGVAPQLPSEKPHLGSRFRVPVGLFRGVWVGLLIPIVAIAGGTGAARLALLEGPGIAPDFRPAREPVAPHATASPDVRAELGLAQKAPVKERSHKPAPRHSRRVRSARVMAVLPPPRASRPSDPGSEPTRRKKAPSVRKEADEPEPVEEPPAPPGAPLFDCYSSEEMDHFITTDRGSAMQAESSKARYKCSIVGYVYSHPAPHTSEIEVDAGEAFVFAQRGAETKPECEKVALYKHETGWDYWYSTRPSDSGFMGYMKP